MDCKINWTKVAWNTFEKNILYLQKEWTEKELSNFIKSVDNKISSLSKHPLIGTSKGHPDLNIRSVLVHKRILLIYKFYPTEKKIDLLVFWNTAQNPRKLRLK